MADQRIIEALERFEAMSPGERAQTLKRMEPAQRDQLARLFQQARAERASLEPANRDPAEGPGRQFLSGANTMLATMAGIPGSTLNALVPGQPFVGVQGMQDLARRGGFILNPPETSGEQFANLAGQNVAAAPVGLATSAPAQAAGLATRGLAGTVRQALAPTTRAGGLSGQQTFNAAQTGALPGATVAPQPFNALRLVDENTIFGSQLRRRIGAELSASGAAAAGGTIAGAPGSHGESLGQLAGVAVPVVALPSGAAILRGAFRGFGEPEAAQARHTIQRFINLGAEPTVGLGLGGSRAVLSTLESLLESVPGGHGPLSTAANNLQQSIGRSMDRLAASITPRELDVTATGRLMQRGLEQFVDGFRARAGGLYSNLDAAMPPTSAWSADNLVRTMQEITQAIPESPAVSAAIQDLGGTALVRNLQEAVAADMASNNGQLSWRTLQGIRSSVGNALTDVSRIDSVPRGQLKRIYGALTDDMREAAMAQGQDAFRAWNQANRYYQAGIKRIDDFVQPLLDKVDFDQVFNQVINSPSRAQAIRRSLSPEEWAAVTSTFIRRMGRAQPSRQGASDELSEVFSTETFLTNYNKLSPRSKAILFDGGRYDIREAMDQISEVAGQIRAQGGIFANPSGTAGRGLAAASLFSGMSQGMQQVLRRAQQGIGAAALTAGGAAAGGPFGAIGALAGGALTADQTARLMTNPRFVKWLARSTQIQPRNLPGHISRLTNIGANDPEFNEALSAYIDDLRMVSVAFNLARNDELAKEPQQPAGTPGNVLSRIRGIAGQ